MSRDHNHPQSSKITFSQFCLDHNFEFEILDEISDKSIIIENYFYYVVKQSDVVNVIKRSRLKKMYIGDDYGLLAYNENLFYEIIQNGISSIGIDWRKMVEIATEFVLKDLTVKKYLPTIITKRSSF